MKMDAPQPLGRAGGAGKGEESERRHAHPAVTQGPQVAVGDPPALWARGGQTQGLRLGAKPSTACAATTPPPPSTRSHRGAGPSRLPGPQSRGATLTSSAHRGKSSTRTRPNPRGRRHFRVLEETAFPKFLRMYVSRRQSLERARDASASSREGDARAPAGCMYWSAPWPHPAGFWGCSG